MKKTKILKERGITLIALVITIIVLLILAGVSIAMLTGQNGILTQAQKAGEQTDIGQEKEAIALAYNGAKAENNGGDVDADDLDRNFGYNDTKADATDVVDGTITVRFEESQRTYTIDANGNISDPTTPPDEVAGKYYETDTEITVGDETITIPGGATVSKIPGEYENIDNGFVIYITNGEEITNWDADTNSNEIKDVQETYDQFVWVPVEKAYVTVEEMGGDSLDNLKSYITEKKVYPMAVKSGDTYTGILYGFKDSADGTKVKITPKDYKTASSYREPDVVSYYDEGGCASEGVTKSVLQSEYKEMVEGVNAKGGFWVGRYETSNMKSSDSEDVNNIIKVVKGTTNRTNNVNWYRMYAQQKNYAKNKFGETAKTKSNMIWGSQWDQIMIWMKDIPAKFTNETYTGKFYITNAVGMGNYGAIAGVSDGYTSTSSPAETGCFDVKNVFDLAGNVYEWTLEAYAPSVRVLRRRHLQHYY